MKESEMEDKKEKEGETLVSMGILIRNIFFSFLPKDVELDCCQVEIV